MKRLLFILFSFISINLFAQVPYFGSSSGKDRLYTYWQYKFTPGYNNQFFYVSGNYGVTNNLDVAINYHGGMSTMAFGGKYSFLDKKHIKLAIQPMVDFDMSDNCRYVDTNIGLYLNGNITGKLGYISNTWYTNTRGENDWDQWTYLTYDWIVTPAIGATTHFSDKCKTDLVIGCWFTTKKVTWYIWGTNLTQNRDKTKLIIGFDYKPGSVVFYHQSRAAVADGLNQPTPQPWAGVGLADNSAFKDEPVLGRMTGWYTWSFSP